MRFVIFIIILASCRDGILKNSIDHQIFIQEFSVEGPRELEINTDNKQIVKYSVKSKSAPNFSVNISYKVSSENLVVRLLNSNQCLINCYFELEISMNQGTSNDLEYIEIKFSSKDKIHELTLAIRNIKNESYTQPTLSEEPVENYKVKLGVNGEESIDYQRTKYFTDIVKSARGFWEIEGKSLAFDVEGWPNSDFLIHLITDSGDVEFSANPTEIAGVYHISFNGQAEVSRIQNKTFNPLTNLTKGTITLGPGERGLYLTFINSKKYPQSSINTGISNLKVIRPGYDLETKQLFTNEFINSLSNFETLRFMDLLNTNHADELDISWENRVLPSFPIQKNKNNHKWSWEYVVELAKLTKKNIWITIPHTANDEYIKKLAQFFYDNLHKTHPYIKVYVEWSNEVWNGIFKAMHDNLEKAQSDLNLFLPGETNVDYYLRAWRRIATKIVFISKTFRNVYEENGFTNPINEKILPVLASQISWPALLVDKIKFIQDKFGPPNNFIYAIAGAPYFGPDRSDTLDHIFEDLNKSITGYATDDGTHRTSFLDYYSISQAAGIKFIAYEGGLDTGQGLENLTTKISASEDFRMKETIKNYLGKWFACGGQEFMYFNLCTASSRWGQWGLTDNVSTLSPKLLGVHEILKSDVRTFDCSATTYQTLGGSLGTGNGLKGEYFKSKNIGENLVETRVDPIINFHWEKYKTSGPTLSDLFEANQDYSVRWTGYIEPRFSEEYTFTAQVHDGIRLWIDNKLIIDDWIILPNPMVALERNGKIQLIAGQKYSIKMEMFSNWGWHEKGGIARLFWKSLSQNKTIVSRFQAYSE